MRLFLIKLFKISFVFYIILWLLQYTIDVGLSKNNNDTFNTLNKIYNSEINADILFFGTSRTLRHYDPKIFEEKLALKSFNLGINGTHYDSQFLRQIPYFKYNKKPQIVIQNVDIISLFKTEELNIKEQYFPYYDFDNYKLLRSFDNDIVIEYVLPMYKYRGYSELFNSSLRGYFSSSFESENINGYIPEQGEWSDRFNQLLKKMNGKNFTYNHINFKERFNVFYKLMEHLKQNSDYVIMVWAPQYQGRLNLGKDKLSFVKNKYIEFANRDEEVYFLDFTKDSICNTTEYFVDSNHLNKKGAELFSAKVADSVEVILRNKIK